MDGMKEIQYPYTTPGSADQPKTLGDLQDSFYAWDANEINVTAASLPGSGSELESIEKNSLGFKHGMN